MHRTSKGHNDIIGYDRLKFYLKIYAPLSSPPKKKKWNPGYAIGWTIKILCSLQETVIDPCLCHSFTQSSHEWYLMTSDQSSFEGPIHRVKWRHSNLWSHYDLYVFGQLGVLCEVKWWRFVGLFQWNRFSCFKKMSVRIITISLESDVTKSQ